MSIFEILLLFAGAVVAHRVLFDRNTSVDANVRCVGRRIRHFVSHHTAWIIVIALIGLFVFPRMLGRMPVFGVTAFGLAVVMTLALSESENKRRKRDNNDAEDKDQQDWDARAQNAARPVVAPLPPQPQPYVQEEPAHASVSPRPPRPPRPLHLPHATEYPEKRQGWFGMMFSAFAMLAMLTVGSYFCVSVTPTQHVVTPTHHAVAVSHQNHDAYAQGVSDSHTDDYVLTDSAGTQRVRTVSLGPEDVDGVGLLASDQLLTLSSHERAEAVDAQADLEKMLVQLSRNVVYAEKGVHADYWQPPGSWVRQTFGPFEKHSMVGEGDVLLTQMTVQVDRTQELINSIIQRFETDRQTHRTIRLGQVYAGTVLILGGLAIFLRLGTGRRPTK